MERMVGLHHCLNCGGQLIGDGLTAPIHCENLDLSESDIEADFPGELFCDGEDWK